MRTRIDPNIQLWLRVAWFLHVGVEQARELIEGKN